MADGSVAEVKEALAQVGYLADEPAALVSYLAQRLGKPVLVEGPAGVGKTELAKALSRATGRELIRLQCYEGLDEAKALYEWNYRKQLLRIQADREKAAPGRGSEEPSIADSSGPRGSGGGGVLEDIFGKEFLLERPLLQAIASPEPVVLLIDEIDKTDQEFEAMLLELLSDFQITIPELGAGRGDDDADRRPHLEQLARADRGAEAALPLPLARLPRAGARDGDRPPPRARARRGSWRGAWSRWCGWCAALDLKKPPSIAESIDWARALLLMGAEDIDRRDLRATRCRSSSSTAPTSSWSPSESG